MHHPEIKEGVWAARWQAQEETEREAFRIKDDASADWYVSKIAAIDAEMALLKAQAEAAIKRLQTEKEGLETLYQGQLEAYVRQVIEGDKRGRKSHILPHGTCKFTKVPARLTLAGETEAVAYTVAEHLPCWKQQFDRTAYQEFANERLHTHGELLPGVERVPERESFKIVFGRKGEEA